MRRTGDIDSLAKLITHDPGIVLPFVWVTDLVGPRCRRLVR